MPPDPGQEPFVLDASRWFGGPPLEITDLRGKVVMIEAFQMLCPGCVNHGLPQAQRVRRTFSPDAVTVLGLHTVFEHHEVMTDDALAVFLAEYRIAFPVAVDRPDGVSTPVTMTRYGLRGTPTALLLDKAGRLRHEFFGQVEDLVLGTRIGELLSEPVE